MASKTTVPLAAAGSAGTRTTMRVVNGTSRRATAPSGTISARDNVGASVEPGRPGP
jgi:hypothetical protein